MWNPFAGKPAPGADLVVRACELAWADGCRTGLVAGFLLGVVVGVVCTVLILRAREAQR